MTHPRNQVRLRTLLIALCAFGYLYVFPYQSKLNNPNENVRFYMTAALVEEGRYEIDAMRARWGAVNDAAVRDGHHYSVKAPGTSFLGMPGYALYRAVSAALDRPFHRIEALWVCRFSASILPTLLWLFFLHRWLCRLGHPAVLRDAVFVSVALGSLLYGYGMLFVSHTLSAVTAFSAFMLLYDARQREESCSSARALCAGLLAAATTLFEYPGLPCSIVLTLYALYVLWPRGGYRAVVSYALGGLVPALLMMHFQWRAFGNPLTPGHLMVENESFRAIHERGLYGAVGPSLPALHGLLTDLGAGLFPLTPVLLATPLGAYALLGKSERARRPDAICALSLSLLTLLAIASMANWRGGWTIGPRYLALVIPFVAWLSLEGLAWLSRRPRTRAASYAFALGATAAAMLASGIPSVYYPHLPEEITRPLAQLFSVLIAHDYAPRNAGALLGLFGSASMLPLLLAALSALALCLASLGTLRLRLQVSALAIALLCALTLPLWLRPAREPGVANALAFITRRFTPEGHDRAARLHARLSRAAAVSIDEREQLAKLYEAEGRHREAARVREASRGKLSIIQ